jgi:hypothetical protein
MVAAGRATPYIRVMPIRPFISCFAALAVVAVAPPAVALDILVPGAASPPSAAELQILNNIRSRETFQLEQRINREIDRLTIQQPTQRLDVPRAKPTCKQDINGQKMLRACR